MKTKNMLLAGLLILVVGGLAYAAFGFFGWNLGKNANPEGENLGLKAISTGTTGEGDVSIELTPLSFDNGRLIVAFAANTHSVALDNFDLKQITTLEYADKIIKPSSAPSMSGHHVTGQLAFDVGDAMNGFTIKIYGIPKAEKRIFEWK